FFFFQAEDGIRDFHVTGVQTCALPISRGSRGRGRRPVGASRAAPLLRCHPVRGAARSGAPQTRDRVRHAVPPPVLAILGRCHSKAGYGRADLSTTPAPRSARTPVQGCEPCRTGANPT